MVSVTEAIDQIRSNTVLLPSHKISLVDAAGLILAEDIFAPLSIPGFDQSAMDGYALRYADLLKKSEFMLAGEVAAGDMLKITIPPHHAVRIFTGAAVPADLDTVVMQEKTEINSGNLIVTDQQLSQGSNVRTTGSEIKKGELALLSGTTLTPAAVGFLAGLGITEVMVYPTPVVHIIVTGKELKKPGQPLLPGKVYESNSFMLKAALEQLGISNITIAFTGDDLNETRNAISTSLDSADLILLTGGVSVGNYDFVVKAAEACGIKTLFHKVKQRPGKPLYAGIKDQKILFGLPGNPASVLTCFYNYVLTAIECMTGKKNLLQKRFLPLAAPCNKKAELTQFLKAVCTNSEVMPLSAQESYRLSSFSIANCLIVLPEEKFEFPQGEIVETFVLPYL